MTVIPFRPRVDDDGPVSPHWLLFNATREVTGCACGFEADMDADYGYGDTVVDHLLTVHRPTTNVGAVRDNRNGPNRTVSAIQPGPDHLIGTSERG